MNKLDIYPYNKKHDRKPNSVEATENYLTNFFGKETLVLNSARVGMYYALQFLGLKRSDHILTPPYMCQSVLSVLNKTSFPVQQADRETRAVLLYHQWGYPQKMDDVLREAKKNNLIVVEDCANSFNSEYKGKRVGTFGEVAIWSFPKLFPTYIGGALTSSNKELVEYVREVRNKRRSFYNTLFNTVVTHNAKRGYERDVASTFQGALFLASIHFPNISRCALRRFPSGKITLESVLQKRENNYFFLKNNIKEEYLIPDHDPDIDVTPFCLPIFMPQKKLERAQRRLLSNNIHAEILHFDVNRNIFKPDYKKSLALPCHQYVDESMLSKMNTIVNEL